MSQQTAGPRVAAQILLLIVTALLLHLTIEHHDNMVLRLGLALVQLGCAGFLAIGGNTRPVMGRLAPFACCLLLPIGLLAPKPGMVAMVLVSHTSIYLGLTWLFGRSLRPGHEPLVTSLAATVEPTLTTTMRRYTRQVTWLWTLYGPVQIALSLILLASAPLALWSAFVNLGDLPLLVCVLLGEYGFRRWWLKGSSKATLGATLAAASRCWQCK